MLFDLTESKSLPWSLYSGCNFNPSYEAEQLNPTEDVAFENIKQIINILLGFDIFGFYLFGSPSGWNYDGHAWYSYQELVCDQGNVLKGSHNRSAMNEILGIL